MPYLSTARVRLHTLFLLALGCCLAFFLWSGTAHASPPVSLTLQVDVGFQVTFREGDWTPVQVTIQNNGADFTGTLAVNTVSGPRFTSTVGEVSPWSSERPITLARGSQKQVTLYIPFSMGNLIPTGVIATVRDARGNKVAEQVEKKGLSIASRNLFVGLLSDPATNFDALTRIHLPNQTDSLTTSYLDASTMPTMAAALQSFDVIILDDFSSNTLQPDQLAALQTWVNQGGVLIEAGGAQWQRTLGPLPTGLLPVTLDSTDMLPAGTHLWPITGPSSPTVLIDGETDGIPTPTAISSGTLRSTTAFSTQETLLTQETTPLITQAHQGQGAIYYLAFDIGGPQLTTWPGVKELWTRIFTHAFGDLLLVTTTTSLEGGPGNLLMHGSILNMIEQPTFTGPWLLGVLLLGYLLMLGPLRLLILHWFKLPKWWGWRICAASVLVFSLLAYGLAQYQKGSLLSNNSISLIQINQGGSSAHSVAYMGIFVPSDGSFSLHIPGRNLTQPLGSQFLSQIDAQSDPITTFTSGTNESTLELHDLGPWTFHPVISEQDLQLHGSLLTHLTLNNNRLVGTVTNTLPSNLSDVYILFPHSFARVGQLAAGKTQQVNLPLVSAAPGAKAGLANQIIQQGGLSTNYFPYTQNQQLQTDFQRHMALLSALGGTGFSYIQCNGSCTTHTIFHRNALFLTDGHTPGTGIHNNYDPLLLAGAPATLIGWADQPPVEANTVTINGSPPSGYHDSFLQMPLSIDLTGSSDLPADAISGHIAAINSFDAQIILPGIYTLSTGSITFEIPIPDTLQQSRDKLTIIEPDLLAHPSGPRPGDTSTSSLLGTLYNWQTGSWDTITFRQDSFTTTQITNYLGPNGRILLQIASQHHAKIYFGKPSLASSDKTNI